MASNTSGISPTEYNVLIKKDSGPEKIGGVYLPDSTKDRKETMGMKGRIVAVSPLAFTYERWPEGEAKPQPGQLVLITKASGVEVEGNDGEKYWLVNDKNIMATVEDPFADLDAQISELNKEAVNG